MHRKASLLFTMLLLFSITPAAFAAPPDPPGARGMPPATGPAADRWIVTLVDSVDSSAVAGGLAHLAGGQTQHVYRHALNGFSFVGPVAAADALARHPLVASVSADAEVSRFEAIVPEGISRIDAAPYDDRPGAHDSGYTGEGVTIAVLDSGVSAHRDLNLLEELGNDCSGDGVGDRDGHGTHVAGTAAGTGGDNGTGVVGVAPDAAVIDVKVLGDDGSGSFGDVICGIDYVTGLVTADAPEAPELSGPVVANMSLGGPSGGSEDKPLEDAITASVEAGVVFVASAGNSAADADGFVPARFDTVITVSAIADFDGEGGGEGGCRTIRGFGPPRTQCDDGFAYFSNFGAAVDVTAPGFEVLSTWLSDGTNRISGTSMSAPHVAGTVALMLEQNPDLTHGEVLTDLQVSGECPDGSETDDVGVCTSTWTGGRNSSEPLVNAYRAAAMHDDDVDDGPTTDPGDDGGSSGGDEGGEDNNEEGGEGSEDDEGPDPNDGENGGSEDETSEEPGDGSGEGQDGDQDQPVLQGDTSSARGSWTLTLSLSTNDEFSYYWVSQRGDGVGESDALTCGDAADACEIGPLPNRDGYVDVFWSTGGDEFSGPVRFGKP